MRKKLNLAKLFPLLVLIFFALFVGGCAKNQHAEINKLFKGVDVSLGMSDKDAVAKLGEGEVSPCVAGYERNYPRASLNVGFNQETQTVRRITLKNAQYSWGTIHVGDSIQKASNYLSSIGFRAEQNSRVKFIKEGYRVTLTSFRGEKVDEIVVEIKQ